MDERKGSEEGQYVCHERRDLKLYLVRLASISCANTHLLPFSARSSMSSLQLQGLCVFLSFLSSLAHN